MSKKIKRPFFYHGHLRFSRYRAHPTAILTNGVVRKVWGRFGNFKKIHFSTKILFKNIYLENPFFQRFFSFSRFRMIFVEFGRFSSISDDFGQFSTTSGDSSQRIVKHDAYSTSYSIFWFKNSNFFQNYDYVINRLILMKKCQ